ncbi:MAG: transcription-repair coupling factor [Alphaproteobacteria bacterium]
MLDRLVDLLSRPGRVLVHGAPEGRDAHLLAALAAAIPGRDLVFIARDESRLIRMGEALAFFAPDVELLRLPAWDCLPYDRVSPNPGVLSQRMEALARLAEPDRRAPAGRVVLTTVSAALQRVPPRATAARTHITARAGEPLDRDALVAFLAGNGYARAETVMEAGDYALRGSIIDVFPAGADQPLRIDLFGDEVEALRTFDPLTQRSTGKLERVDLMPVSEVLFDDDAVGRFRSGYRQLFGAVTGEDPLYAAVSAGRRHAGMEHWLPLFHGRLETIFAYIPDAPIVLDHLAEEARDARLAVIADHYAARVQALKGRFGEQGAVYKPVPPEKLFLDAADWQRLIEDRPVAALHPYRAPEASVPAAIDAGGKRARDFATERARQDVNLFDAVRDYVGRERAAGRRMLVACYSAGSRDRLAGLLKDHGTEGLHEVANWAEAARLPREAVAVTVLGLEHGFETSDLVVLGEQDLLGDRLGRPPRRARQAEGFIAEVSHLSEGDLVVHVDHGIGRYDGLVTLTLSGAPHDCLRNIYDGGDKLYVPVENIDVLSRYGGADAPVQLDKLGSAAWQARKARLKRRIRDMAAELLRIAADRRLRKAHVIARSDGWFDEFCARFPYAETEDQVLAIDHTLDDLEAGRPTDRLICGDVGFGKTEVALRAAFVTVMAGAQVAVVVPTTLLCRQHYLTFQDRFRDLPVRVEQLSRLVPARRVAEVKEGLASGQVDIVIGTHALLANDIRFKGLGLLVVDEEQHFGVAHKERLKRLKADVHVLAMTATPIPRTLYMALSGLKELSIIATPPIDRLAVRTFIMPYDPVMVREAILRERYRGGQIFCVCPRIEELEKVAEQLKRLVPDVKLAVAHGRMPARALESVTKDFYDGALDLLVSTAIIEAGLDLPNVNTLIVHRADMFGLAQLYQLRGRIGRGKVRAYAYLTLPPGQALSGAAAKRLEVMHKLDGLGAGFSLASHDLDIRGAGNLLGAEQSGHIREVGLELYQTMLAEAVAALRAAEEGTKPAAEPEWSPQINTGTAVLIPETYVGDLGVRLGLYRRIAVLEARAEIDAFAVELVDRFGPLPEEVKHLLEIVAIKKLCRAAGVERVEAGRHGAILTFRGNSFPNPAGLVDFIADEAGGVRLRPDHRLVVTRGWEKVDDRLAGIQRLLESLAEIARAAAETEASAEGNGPNEAALAR